MTTKQAIEQLDEMQRQIIHGKRIFGDIADILRAADHALNAANVAVGNEHKEYSLGERVEWLAAVKDCFRRQVDELRAKSPNAPAHRRQTQDHEST